MILATRSRVVDDRLPSSILTARIYLNDIFAGWRILHAGRALPYPFIFRLLCLSLGIYPMQVFEDDHERLIETLTQDDSLDRVQGTAVFYLRVHLREWIGIFLYCQHIPQIRRGMA
jgi:hypothetical protein